MSELEQKVKQKLFDTRDSTTLKVRVDDTDLMQVVHFKNYLMYFDQGFVSFMDGIVQGVSNCVEKGIVFPVKRIEIIYENSAKFGDNVLIETRVKEIGKKSITFLHELFRESDKALLAKVESVRLAMDWNTKELLNIVEFFAQYM
jgi:acyl-CoA thioester hydrolase